MENQLVLIIEKGWIVVEKNDKVLVSLRSKPEITFGRNEVSFLLPTGDMINLEIERFTLLVKDPDRINSDETEKKFGISTEIPMKINLLDNLVMFS